MIVLCAGSLDAISENLCPDDVLLTAVQRITDLNGGTIQDYYQRKQKNGGRSDGRKGGLSAKTIQNQHMLLKDFFAYAMRKYHLPCNPTIDTTRPVVITPEMRVLSPSEMQVFIEEVMRETQGAA